MDLSLLRAGRIIRFSYFVKTKIFSRLVSLQVYLIMEASGIFSMTSSIFGMIPRMRIFCSGVSALSMR